ncbi:MAG: SRPBCC family protein [Thaumarchaeota archaeon]|nr:SRPBCC family protein [Nitrososphaerota archaeon]
MVKAKRFHSGVVKRSVVIHSTREKVWRTISNITNLPQWASGIKETVLKSRIRKGVGAIRDVILDDNTSLEEHIVDWRNGHSFSYVAVTGMPVRTYFATLSIKPRGRNSVTLTWSCYINTKKITGGEFKQLKSDLDSLYKTSLKNLKSKLE